MRWCFVFIFLFLRFSYVDAAYYFVVNGGTNQIYIYDGTNDNLKQTITLSFTPLKPCLSNDERYLFLPTSTPTTSLSYIDLKTSLSTLKSVTVGTAPVFVLFTKDNTKAFVINKNSDSVSVLDISSPTFSLKATISTGLSNGQPTKGVLSRDNKFLYLISSNISTGNVITKIDASSNTWVRHISNISSLPFLDIYNTDPSLSTFPSDKISSNPTDIDISLDDRFLYVSSNKEGAPVAVIDTNTHQIVNIIRQNSPNTIKKVLVTPEQGVVFAGGENGYFLHHPSTLGPLFSGSGAFATDAVFIPSNRNTDLLPMIVSNAKNGSAFYNFSIDLNAKGPTTLSYGSSTSSDAPMSLAIEANYDFVYGLTSSKILKFKPYGKGLIKDVSQEVSLPSNISNTSQGFIVSQSNPKGPYLYLMSNGRLDVFDQSLSKVINSVLYPSNTTLIKSDLSLDNRFLVAADSGNKTIHLLDTTTYNLQSLPNNTFTNQPTNVKISPSGDKIYVFSQPTLYVVPLLQTGSMDQANISSYDLDGGTDFKVLNPVFSKNGSYLFVGKANSFYSGFLSIVNTSSYTTKKIDIGPNLLAQVPSPDGRYIYLFANTKGGTLYVFNTAIQKLVNQVSNLLQNTPNPSSIYLTISPDNQYLCLTASGSPGSLVILDTASLTPTSLNLTDSSPIYAEFLLKGSIKGINSFTPLIYWIDETNYLNIARLDTFLASSNTQRVNSRLAKVSLPVGSSSFYFSQNLETIYIPSTSNTLGIVNSEKLSSCHLLYTNVLTSVQAQKRPFPPSNLSFQQIAPNACNSSPQINQISWDPSPSLVAYYNVYKDNVFISKICSNGPFVFNDISPAPSGTTYSVEAIDLAGASSLRISFTPQSN
ncbi:MAG: hypothetical protein ACOVOR_03195 [Rhabdochlamydiaceae bacterium]